MKNFACRLVPGHQYPWVNCKKKFIDFPVLSRDVTNQILPGRVSDIPAGDGKIDKLFYSVIYKKVSQDTFWKCLFTFTDTSKIDGEKDTRFLNVPLLVKKNDKPPAFQSDVISWEKS